MSDNPAQPFINMRDRLYNFAQKYDPSTPSKPAAQKVDTSWHDQMVKNANDSFAKRAAADKAATAKKAAKKPAKKTAPKASIPGTPPSLPEDSV